MIESKKISENQLEVTHTNVIKVTVTKEELEKKVANIQAQLDLFK